MAVPDLKDAIDHLQRRDLDAAIAALEHKIEELPAHLTAHVLLARTYETKHQWSKALTAWETVHFLMPNSPVGQAGKARVLHRLDRHEEAKDAAPSADDGPLSSAPAPSEAEAASPPDTTDSPSADPESPEQPSSDAPSSGPDSSDDAPPSELQQLRRQAEEEARRGGARPNLAAASNAGPGDEAASTPEERVDELDEDDDLDRLIDELQSAEIEPDLDAEAEDVSSPDLNDDIDDLVSETLARIHEAQDQYKKAAQIYVKLASQEPDKARQHLKKAVEMRKQFERTSSEAN
jgi:tetratricopeptide (TPR) repeat protein